MQIHVVQRGQTLEGIAATYDITVEAIIRTNEPPDPAHLVVGQTLVIPIVGRFHWVQPGESLYSIGQLYGIPYETIARVNRIPPTATLAVGTRLYIPPLPKRRTEMNAYIEPRVRVSSELESSAREAAPYLSYMAPFSFQIQRDGTLKEPPLGNLPDIARRNNVTLMMVVTNLENEQFSAELGRIVLNDEQVQTRLLDTIMATARRLNFRDIHFDMEFLRPEDREAYARFLRRAKSRTSEAGFLMSAALAPKTSATQKGKWYEAHDYHAIGSIVDFVVIMTYEWGYSGGPLSTIRIKGTRRKLPYSASKACHK